MDRINYYSNQPYYNELQNNHANMVYQGQRRKSNYHDQNLDDESQSGHNNQFPIKYKSGHSDQYLNDNYPIRINHSFNYQNHHYLNSLHGSLHGNSHGIGGD